MREKEYTPLYADGFIEITEKELHKTFVEPFQGQANAHRTDLLLNFGQFWTQFKQLGLSAEVWIDGSFATTAPDPADIDVVFFMDAKVVLTLSKTKQALFEKLFTNRKLIKNLYKIEAFYADKYNEATYIKWQKDFGTGYDNTTKKGIFRIFYK